MLFQVSGFALYAFNGSRHNVLRLVRTDSRDEDGQTKTVRSVCPYCGVGCGIVMQVEDNPTNFGRLCTKGNTCGQAIAKSGRMENAYLRQERNRDPARIAMVD